METQQRQDTQSESYTIVRIKRKRNEEPLDALGTSCVHVHALISTLNVFCNLSCRPGSEKETI